MRIDLSLLRREILFSSQSFEWLVTLLGERGSVEAIVDQVLAHALVLRVQGQEVELPRLSVEKGDTLIHLSRGDSVELSLLDGNRLEVRVMPSSSAVVPQHEPPSRAEQALLKLNIQPTEEAVAVVESLVKLGLPVKEETVSVLVPWAEQGQLEAVLPLVKGGFPLLPELVDLMEHSELFGLKEPLVVNERLSELEQVLGSPHLWFSRSQLAEKIGKEDTETVVQFTKVFLQERLLENFVNQKGNGTQFVFAWPVLLGESVFAGWIRLTKEAQSKEHGSSHKLIKERYRVMLDLPTQTLGMVQVEIELVGTEVSCEFVVDNSVTKKRLEKGLALLNAELKEQGWEQVESTVVINPDVKPLAWTELVGMADEYVSFIDVRG